MLEQMERRVGKQKQGTAATGLAFELGQEVFHRCATLAAWYRLSLILVSTTHRVAGARVQTAATLRAIYTD